MTRAEQGTGFMGDPLIGDVAQDGFAVLEGFVEQREMAGVQAEVEAIAAAPHPPSCARPHNTLLPLRWNHRLVGLLLASQRRVNAVREAAGAQDLRWISGYISLKEAGSLALWWHQDWWCWDHPVSFRPAAPQIAVLCYLNQTDTDSGALRVLPGSHRRSVPIHGVLPDAHSDTSISPRADHPAMSNLAGQKTLSLSAGDAVIIDYRLLHGTHPNASGQRRDCIILNFTPCWRGLPAELQAHLISHPAQPLDAEDAPSLPWQAALLPTFPGARRDLNLNRNAPSQFEIAPEPSGSRTDRRVPRAA